MKMRRSNRTPVLLLAAVTVLAAQWAGCSGKKSSPAAAADTAKDTSGRTAAAVADTVLPYEARQGKFLFTKYCAVCHGEDGKGDGFNAYNLDPKPRDFTDARLMQALTDERIAETISGGGRSVNKSPLMPSWGGRLKRREIGYLVRYVRSFLSKQ